MLQRNYAWFYRFSKETNTDLSCCALTGILPVHFLALHIAGQTLQQLRLARSVDSQVNISEWLPHRSQREVQLFITEEYAPYRSNSLTKRRDQALDEFGSWTFWRYEVPLQTFIDWEQICWETWSAGLDVWFTDYLRVLERRNCLNSTFGIKHPWEEPGARITATKWYSSRGGTIHNSRWKKGFR